MLRGVVQQGSREERPTSVAGAIKEGGCTSFLAPILIPEGPSMRAEPAQPAPPTSK